MLRIGKNKSQMKTQIQIDEMELTNEKDILNRQRKKPRTLEL